MRLYSTSEIAELLGVARGVITYHIKQGNLKAEKNKRGHYMVNYNDFLIFDDFRFFDMNKERGVKKEPTIIEYYQEPQKYIYCKDKILRNEQIIKDRANKMRYKKLTQKYNLSDNGIRRIINNNIDYLEYIKKPT